MYEYVGILGSDGDMVYSSANMVMAMYRCIRWLPSLSYYVIMLCYSTRYGYIQFKFKLFLCRCYRKYRTSRLVPCTST